MSRASARAAGAVAWVAVVAVGALLVWLVISRAGNGLVADAGPVTTPTTSSAAPGVASSGTPGTARRGSWQGEAGVVTATCQGGAIALVGAQPEDGLVVKVREQGPERLVVTFQGGDDGSVTVTGTCVGGRPQFMASAGATESVSPAAPSSGATSEGGDDSSGHGSDDG